ncbi:MAG: AraC family transcriptional regulator [Eubacterium sp.]|nr:AraC family transcriptional regulator [Eubacterium sp.]
MSINNLVSKSESTYEHILTSVNYEKKASVGDASYSYHRHDACEIFLFLSGNIRFYIEQACFEPTPGSLVILNPAEMHRVQSIDNSPYERIIINIKKDYMDYLSTDDLALSDCFYSRALGKDNLRILSDETLREFLDLYARLEASRPEKIGNTIGQNAYISLLLLLINTQFMSEKSKITNTMPNYITGTMQYLASHLEDPLDLKMLSDRYHISAGYLSSQFKAHTGLTLRSYLLDCKITHAKTLLQQGASVTEACFHSGFNDYANFIRSFKKITGKTPGKYKM